MTTENNENVPPPPEGTQRRRSSFAEMFGTRPSIDTSSANGKPQGAMANVMAQQRNRRLSITTLGLSGSPTRGSGGASAFDTLRDRGQSVGGGQTRPRASTTSDANENAIEDEDAVPPMNGEAGSRPQSPGVQRRLSFGAMAYRDSMRAASGGSTSGETGGSPDSSSSKSGSPPASARRDGFNWSEKLRSRAQRSSISHAQGGTGGFLPLTGGAHGRAKSMAEPAAMPAQPKSPPPKAPDHFQERILKGDFYMD